MRATIAMATALLLAACGPDLGDSMDACRYDSMPFAESWPCVRQHFGAIQDAHPQVKLAFLRRGDTIYEAAKAGKLTDAQARQAFGDSILQAKADEAQSKAAYGARDAAILGMMRPYQPPPVPVLGPTIAPTVVCNRVGSQVYCN